MKTASAALAIMLIAVMALTTGCGSDSNNSSGGTLVGTWASVDLPGLTITFGSNGSFTVAYSGYSEVGSYTSTTSTVTTTLDGDSDTVPYSISGNSLTVTVDGAQEKYTRV